MVSFRKNNFCPNIYICRKTYRKRNSIEDIFHSLLKRKMSTNNGSTSVQYNTIFNDTTYLFWFVFTIICIIPSFFCSLFDFFHFFKFRKTLIYNNISHHVFFCLLINDFFEMTVIQPLTLIYFYFGHVKGLTLSGPIFCMIWVYAGYILVTQSLFFTMYASIERYMLLFHKQFVLSHKILAHYIPLLITILYLPCVLFYLIFFFPCERYFDYTMLECGVPCFINSIVIGTLNDVLHIFVPVSVIVIFNTLILIRVLILKRRTLSSSSGNNLWKQNRHMILQLGTISLLTLMAWIPYVIGILIQILANPMFATTLVFFYFLNATCIPNFGTSFLIILGFPQEIRQKMFSCVTYPKRRKSSTYKTATT